MIVKQKNKELETIGDFNESSATVDSADLDLVIDMISSRLYNNRIGAFIREITSNCSDATRVHIKEKPVIIKVYEEDGEWFISFRDYGKGMSKEFIQKVYLSVFKSDKRTSNVQKGGWGVGSKSPMSYCDSFNIDTIHEGVKYSYIYYKDGKKQKCLLLEEQETKETSGTLVTIPLKYNDLIAVSREINNQLAYFKNVIVFNNYRSYENSYTIYEGVNFLYRQSKQAEYMHISSDEISYPIDFDIVDIPHYMRKIPIALKFETGELSVPLSREHIEYFTEEDSEIEGEFISVKDKIEKKAKEAIKELKSIYTTNKLFTDDFKDLFKSSLKKENLIIADNVEIPYTKSITEGLQAISFKGMSVQGTFSFIRGMQGSVFSEICTSQSWNVSKSSYYLNGNKFYKKVRNDSKWEPLYFGNNKLIFKDKDLINLKFVLKLMGHDFIKEVQRRNNHTLVYEGDDRTIKEKKNKYLLNFGYKPITKEFRKDVLIVFKLLKEFYDKATPYVAPKWFIEEEKAKEREQQALYKENISYYISLKQFQYENSSEIYRYEKKFYYELSRTTINYKELLFDKMVYLYIEKKKDRSHVDIYNHITLILSRVPKYYRDNFKVIIMSKTTIKKYNKIPNLIHYKSIFEEKDIQRFLIKQYICFVYQEKMPLMTYRLNENLSNPFFASYYYRKQFRYVHNSKHTRKLFNNEDLYLIKSLGNRNLIAEIKNGVDALLYFEDTIKNLFQSHHEYVVSYIFRFKKLKEKYDKLEILKYFNLDAAKITNPKVYYNIIKLHKLFKI